MKSRIFGYLKWLSLASLLILIALLIGLRLRYGGGNYYPDLSTPPLLPETALETVVQYSEPIGNIAVNHEGRLFFTVHPESRPTTNKLLEWKNGQAVPYPNLEMQQTHFQTVLGLVIDSKNRLWTIDHGFHGFGRPRLLAFDLTTNQIVHDHTFTNDIAQRGSFLQAMQIDSRAETIYIADVSFFRKNPAIIVYDVATQQSRRCLESHPSVYPQDWIIRNPTKEMVFFGGLLALKPGVDGITIDKQDEWIYYGAMVHESLYRVRTADLRNKQLSATELAPRVELFSKKPLNDGLSMDKVGNVFITDVEHSAVVWAKPDRQLQTVIRSPRIRWADALCFGPEGWLYLADSAIPDQMLQTKTHIQSRAPYFIYRFRPGTEGVPGQ
jgi:sugar lactone lactonase YvrE